MNAYDTDVVTAFNNEADMVGFVPQPHPTFSEVHFD